MTQVSPQGVDLREYSKQVELELQEVERASIRDCVLCGGAVAWGVRVMVSPDCPLVLNTLPDIKESENIASLHNQITACDAILEVRAGQGHSQGVPNASPGCPLTRAVLCSPPAHGADVGRVPVRPEQHQLRDPDAAGAVGGHDAAAAQSPRRAPAARAAPGPARRPPCHDQVGHSDTAASVTLCVPFVTSRPPRSTILEAPVTEPEFLEQLQELNGKIDSVKEQAFRETVACADVQHILEKLKIKVRTLASDTPKPQGHPKTFVRFPPFPGSDQNP